MQFPGNAGSSLVSFLTMFWLAGPAWSSLVYYNDFQDAVGSEWSDTTVSSAPNPDYQGDRLFLGEFGNDSVTLSLAGLEDHSELSVSFELFVIRSWDGNDTTVFNDPLGPDRWQLSVDGSLTLLDTTFSNGNPAGQAYAPDPFSSGCSGYAPSQTAGVHAPMTGASECYSLGYTFDDIPNQTFDESMDSVYNLAFSFAHTGDSLLLDFSGSGLQGLADESWGIDNVNIEIASVPLPGALGLLVAGLIPLTGLGLRKNR